MKKCFYLPSILGSLFIFTIVLISSACGDKEEESMPQNTFGIFEKVDENTVIMDGEIDDFTLEDFNELIDSHPSINRINIKEVPGSDNDEINLQVSQKVYHRNMQIHLMDDGLIASGGVDFFLAGNTRTKGVNTKIGVHSWSDGTNEATDFPQGDANHQPYINYYTSIGFSQEEAETFYYFTINAAAAADIHWMTEEEIIQYKILK